MVVGAPWTDEFEGCGDPCQLAGSAYVFERDPQTNRWTEVAILIPSKLVSIGWGDEFGTSVAIDGDTIVVGAYGADNVPTCEGSCGTAGAVYVFERDEGGQGNWGEVAFLSADDAVTGDWFGYSVAIDGEHIVVGTPRGDDVQTCSQFCMDAGAAYVFERFYDTTDRWKQVAKLTASDVGNLDFFGQAVAISGNTIVVGAWNADDAPGCETSCQGSGAAYVFEKNTDLWTEVAILTASDAEAGDGFGEAVAIDGDTVVIGAFSAALPDCESILCGDSAGVAYVFERDLQDPNNWYEAATLIPSIYDVNAQFSRRSVAISGDRVVIGAPVAAWVYVFEWDSVDDDSWSEILRWRPDTESVGELGYAVNITGDRVLAGAPEATSLDCSCISGLALTFQLSTPPLGPVYILSDGFEANDNL